MANSTAGEQRIQQYLKQLRRALADLPESRRHSIVEEITAHIQTGRNLLAPDDEAGLAQLLEDLGDPETIRHEAGLGPSPKPSRFDAWVPWLLLLGGFAFAIGWVVGLVLLWRSTVFRLRDKLLGTFIWPGGLFGALVVMGLSAGSSSCSGLSAGPTQCVTTGFHLPPAIGLPVLVLSMVLPVLVAVMLSRRLARHEMWG